MGRLASRYADLDIQGRIPYTMDSELTLAASSNGIPFNDSDFLNTQDKVFEVHRLIPRVWALDANSLLLSSQPADKVLNGLVIADIRLQGFNTQVNKSPTRLDTLLKGTSELTWEFAEPFFLPNGRGVQVFITTTAFPAGVAFTQLLIAFTWEGFLLIQAPGQG